MDDIKEQLNQTCRRWRRGEGLSTRQAGERIGLSHRTIEGIEQGRGFSHPIILQLAFKALGYGEEK